MTEVPELRTGRLLLRGFRYHDYERWIDVETLEGHHTTRGFDLLVYGTDLPLDSPA